jgi:hypothetical protein
VDDGSGINREQHPGVQDTNMENTSKKRTFNLNAIRPRSMRVVHGKRALLQHVIRDAYNIGGVVNVRELCESIGRKHRRCPQLIWSVLRTARLLAPNLDRLVRSGASTNGSGSVKVADGNGPRTEEAA